MSDTLQILLVEDDPLTLEALQAGLESRGHTVRVASTGTAAIAIAAAEAPEVLIMDINLAGSMDGIETARAIQAQRWIPVVFLSGHTVEALQDRVAVCRPLALLAKPVRLRELLAALLSAKATGEGSD